MRCLTCGKTHGPKPRGDLTGYLAKTDYAAYGGHWNRLAKESRQRIEEQVMPAVSVALERLQAAQLAEGILLDLNRIALHSAYMKRFPRVPVFFGDLARVYEHGHLPCGWVGDLDAWPVGSMLFF